MKPGLNFPDIMMTVETFDTVTGLYIFKFDNLETELHCHPAVEIAIAKRGSFSLSTETAEFKNLKFAIIEANKKHKITSINCELQVIMIEHHNRFIRDRLALHRIAVDKGYYFQSTPSSERIIDQIIQNINDGESVTEYDLRVSAAIDFLNSRDIAYGTMIKTLQTVTNLSESRLSHLFKANTGISLKKYLIWTKLKSTIKIFLNNRYDLFSSLINTGFYDHPHFSRNFKTMFGVRPSKAYNSRNLQV
jgi:AraC-like DNA-binding protein